MRTVYEEQDWKVSTVEVGEPVDLRDRPVVGAVLPIECIVKPDGDKANRPVLLFIMKLPNGLQAVAQLSERMFRPVIMELDRLEVMNPRPPIFEPNWKGIDAISDQPPGPTWEDKPK